MIFKPSGLLGQYDFSLSQLLEKLLNREPKEKKPKKPKNKRAVSETNASSAEGGEA